MIFSLTYDPNDKRISVLGCVDPAQDGCVRFFINDGDEAFGIPFEILVTLICIEVDREGKVVRMEELPAYTLPSIGEIPIWLRGR